MTSDSARRVSRRLAVLLTALYALFALDTAVISVGFLVHLLALVLAGYGAVIAWSRPRAGAAGFAVAAAASVLLFRTWSAPGRFLLLTLPLLAIAGLHRVSEKPPQTP